jgi:type I restriction enzyme M protein
MATKSIRTSKKTNGRGSLGFEEQLWQSADQLRGNMDAAVYKHVVLGLIFLKYISDAFEQRREEIESDIPELAEDRDEYRGEGVFWVPKEARWDHI